LVPLVAFFLDAVFDSMAFFSLSDFCSFGIRKYGLEFAQIGGSGVAGWPHLTQARRARLVAVEKARKCSKTGAQRGAPAGENPSLEVVAFKWSRPNGWRPRARLTIGHLEARFQYANLVF
jgi:hypothetical protein